MDLELIRYFTKVVQNDSFSRAADILRLPKSTVSKAITRLEAETGTKLLLRTTRSLTLTPAGRAFYDSVVSNVQAIEDGYKSLHGQDSVLSGEVRITAPEDLGTEVISPLVAGLVRQHAGISFELVYTDEVIDLVKEGFDLAFRIGRLTESRLRARKLGNISLIAVASPEYCASKEKIRHPKDLKHHDCLSYIDQAIQTRWHLRGAGEAYIAEVEPKISSNQMSSLMKLAAGGAGVAFVPHYLCRNELREKRLMNVLPDWKSPGMPLAVVSPLPFTSSVRLKITSELLATSVQKFLAKYS
jgi:DNA-binding transcriptional LysR family regulator